MSNTLVNNIRKKIRSNKISIGSWQQIPNSSVSEILGSANYDWVVVDMEHGSISIDQLPDLFRAISLGNTLPLCRVADSDPIECKRVLDAGAGGVVLPMINSSDKLKNLIEACCWPPKGSRGVGFSRANLFGKYFDRYSVEAQSPLIIAQIENIEGVNNIDEILKVSGLDAIIIGPYDLSASMGITADFENTKFVKVIEKILDKCKVHGIPCGKHIVQPDQSELHANIDMGFRFIPFSIDGVFLNSICECPIEN